MSGDQSRRKLRKFGLVVGGVFGLIAAWLAIRHRFGLKLEIVGAISAALIVMALLAPMLLAPIEWAWSKIGGVLGFVNTRILLTLIFFVVLTPIALVLRLLGRDPLERRFDKQSKSYWREHAKPDDEQRYQRPF
jgi:hypothetical protein